MCTHNVLLVQIQQCTCPGHFTYVLHQVVATLRALHDMGESESALNMKQSKYQINVNERLIEQKDGDAYNPS